MTVQKLIRYIRNSVVAVDPDDECYNEGRGCCTDRAYLEMTDEDIRLFLEVCLTRDFAHIPSLEQMPNYCVYPLTLLTKKEIYYSLAVWRAPEVDMNADINNSLRRSQRFEHYMALIKQVDDEYQDWLDNGGGLGDDEYGGAASNTLRTYDVVLPNTRYFTKSYRQRGMKPAPQLYVDDWTSTTAEIRWTNTSRQFGLARVYKSKEPIIDEYKNGICKVVDRDTMVFSTFDPRQTTFRLEGLDPDSDYFIAVEVIDKSHLTGYAQVQLHTREVDDE